MENINNEELFCENEILENLENDEEENKNIATNTNCEDTQFASNIDCKINDYLQDLDDYLDEIDSKSVNSRYEDESHKTEDFKNLTEIQREQTFRKTIDSSLLRKYNKVKNNQNNSPQLRRYNSFTELSPFPEISNNQDNRIEDVSSTIPNRPNMLTEERIFNNFLNDCNQENIARPRQFGRRASGLPTILALRDNRTDSPPEPSPITEIDDNLVTEIHDNIATPPPSSSRPLESGSFRSSISSNRNTNSLVSTSEFSSLSVSPNVNFETTSIAPPVVAIQESHRENQSNQATTNSYHDCNKNWPHKYSQFFSLTSCTLGLFNICRFSLLVANYRGNFILQFLLLSILFGIPMLWLQMCLGGKIKNGPVSMWRISPICKGIGVSLLLIHFLVAIYSSVSITWVFIYLRNSFSKYEEIEDRVYRSYDNFLQDKNLSNIFSKDLGEYFYVDILQRFVTQSHNFQISDRLAFYLVVLWTIAYLFLCKGIKSFGKVIYLLSTVPIIILFVITVKLISIVDLSSFQNIFSSTELDDFLINSQTWIAAAQETFLTWGFLGPSVISITSRTHEKSGKYSLHWNAIFIVLITLVVLTLAAILGLSAVQILQNNNFVYIPGSYENHQNYISIFYKPAMSPEMISHPTKFIPHYSSYVGEVYRRSFSSSFHHSKNGYQALRFLNEIFPAIKVMCRDSFTSVWVIFTLIMFLLFGIAQFCIIWKPISNALSDESKSSVLLSCVAGLLLSIPFATEHGLYILHYTDLLFGASWTVPLLWMMFIFGIFLVRGRPYNGDELVNDLQMSTTMSSFLALSWNILLPIGLIILSIIDYKSSRSNQFYYFREKSNFNFWARKLGGFLQVSILLLVPIIALIQIFRYLSKSSTDLFERIQLLCRPKEGPRTRHTYPTRNLTNSENNDITIPSININSTTFHADSPPKYTPPPSFSTATGGARLAKILRRSIRRLLTASEYSRAMSVGSEQEMIITDIPNAEEENLRLNTLYTENVNTTNERPALIRSFSARRPRSAPLSSNSSRSITTSLTNIDSISNPKGSLRIPHFLNNTNPPSRSTDNLTQNIEQTSQSLPPADEIRNNENFTS